MQKIEELLMAGKIKSYQVTALKSSAAAAEPGKKKLKFGNKKTEVDGIVFDSKKEAKRYGELKILLKAGNIAFLEWQVEYKLTVDGQLVAKYIADFKYLVVATGEWVVEDIKSDITRRHPVYRLKKKLMKACHGIEIKEL